jgi:para-nitrobenzyl esterase
MNPSYKTLLISVVLTCNLFAYAQVGRAQQATPEVKTTYGNVQGFIEKNLNVFLGIPYAQTPRRFEAAKPPRVSDKTFQALEFSLPCPQDSLRGITQQEAANTCLTLNVWSPELDDKKRAVMVFIHGGAFYFGSSEPTFNGANLAAVGDVVVVTLNYRLGFLGYFDYSVIGGDRYGNSVNNGLQDQILALEWVQQNIAVFGGDPTNVTVFGESAGASNLVALLAIENPQRYFKRLIAQSPSPHQSQAESRALSKMVSDGIGIYSDFFWRGMGAGMLLYIQREVLKTVGTPTNSLLFAPTYGETLVMKQRVVDAVDAGLTNDIDLLIGTNLNETALWSTFASKLCTMTAQQNLFTLIDESTKPQMENLVSLFSQNPERTGSTEGDFVLAIADEYLFRGPTIDIAERQAEHGNTYMYLFDYPSNLPQYPCANGRAVHSADLFFMLGNLDVDFADSVIGEPRDSSDAAVREALSQLMMKAWINFAKTGDPNGEGVPAWPTYDATNRATMRLGVESYVENAPFQAEYEAVKEFRETFNIMRLGK